MNPVQTLACSSKRKEAANEAEVWWKLATETKRVLGVSS